VWAFVRGHVAPKLLSSLENPATGYALRLGATWPSSRLHQPQLPAIPESRTMKTNTMLKAALTAAVFATSLANAGTVESEIARNVAPY